MAIGDLAAGREYAPPVVGEQSKFILGECKMRYHFFIIIIFINFLMNCNSEKEEDKTPLLAAIALSSNRPEASTGTKTCDTPIPACSGVKTFANITQNSTHATCTTCHFSTTGYGNFDFSTYSNAISRINTSSPKDSILWQKVASCYSSVGTMGVHSNATFNDLIYCWIASGGTQ